MFGHDSQIKRCRQIFVRLGLEPQSSQNQDGKSAHQVREYLALKEANRQAKVEIFLHPKAR